MIKYKKKYLLLLWKILEVQNEKLCKNTDIIYLTCANSNCGCLNKVIDKFVPKKNKTMIRK